MLFSICLVIVFEVELRVLNVVLGVVRLAWAYGLEVSGWYAAPDLPGRDLRVLQHEGTSGHYRAFADLATVDAAIRIDDRLVKAGSEMSYADGVTDYFGSKNATLTVGEGGVVWLDDPTVHYANIRAIDASDCFDDVTLGGSDANEAAIYAARTFTGRMKVLSRYRSYHGSTLGSGNLSGDPRRFALERPAANGFLKFFDPYVYRDNLPFKTEEEASAYYVKRLREQVIYEGAENVAAIVMETITGSNGVIIPPEGYLPGVRKICDEFGIMMICDEVMAGFGRTGTMFAFEHWGIKPDIISFTVQGACHFFNIFILHRLSDRSPVFFGHRQINQLSVSHSDRINRIDLAALPNAVQRSEGDIICVSAVRSFLQEIQEVTVDPMRSQLRQRQCVVSRALHKARAQKPVSRL